MDTHPEEDVPSSSKLIDLTKSLHLQDSNSYSDEGNVASTLYNSFAILAKKMKNLTEDGLIKKRILSEGYGEVIPDKARVYIHYKAFTQFYDEPFDSTYKRRKPFVFILNSGMTLPGIDIGTQSMKVAEKSQFLVYPQYASKPHGRFQRMPPHTTILFEIEVLTYVDAKTAKSRPLFDYDEEHDFKESEIHIHALCAKACEHATNSSSTAAIKAYNQAVILLERSKLKDDSQREKQQKLLVRCHTNLAILFLKIGKPGRTCINCNKVYYLCKRISLSVPVKVYFNHGRALIHLGDYAVAERKLKQAQCVAPDNIEVSRELLKLDQMKKENIARDLALEKAKFDNKKVSTDTKLSEEFKLSVTDYCKELIAEEGSVHYKLPLGLNENEISFCKSEIEKHGLKLSFFKQDNEVVYVLTKIK